MNRPLILVLVLLLLTVSLAFASEPPRTVYYPAMVWTDGLCVAMGVPCMTGVMVLVETSDPANTAYRVTVNYSDYTDASGETKRKAVLVAAASFPPGSTTATTVVWVPMPREFRYSGVNVVALKDGPDVEPYQR